MSILLYFEICRRMKCSLTLVAFFTVNADRQEVSGSPAAVKHRRSPRRQLVGKSAPKRVPESLLSCFTGLSHIYLLRC